MKINLSELDYDNIRTSLLEYLKKQETVRDLNFEGSAVNFLLDLLAYNTLYYAHYANMISGEAFLDTAQLERSIVSLVKPLGYVLPTRTSSMARIKLTNITSVTEIKPYTVNITGTTPEGSQYQFWNIDLIPVTIINDIGLNETDYFSIYEGIYNSLSYGGDGFDFPNQEILIPDLTTDVKTIKVSVKRADDEISSDYTYWSLLDTYNNNYIESTSNLYSIERRLSGFVVKFQTSANENQVLKSGDRVKIEYLSSNGVVSNSATSFRAVQIPQGSNIITLSPSSGGLDKPNLNLAKKVAPLIFSAQQRLVTKNDYIGFLAQLGYTEGINVWGGEDNTPPIYGRLLFSINGIATTNNSVIREIVSKMKDRSVVTILPEYVPPKSMMVDMSIRTLYTSDLQTDPQLILNNINETINSMFKAGSFAKSLYATDVTNLIESKNLIVDSIGFELKYRILPSNTNIVLNFKNSLFKTNTNAAGLGVRTLPFESTYYDSNTQEQTNSFVIIQDSPIKFSASAVNPPSIGKLKLYSSSDDGIRDLNTEVGEVNYKTGTVIIYPNLFNSNDGIEIIAFPKENYIIAKDEVYLTVNTIIQPPELII